VRDVRLILPLAAIPVLLTVIWGCVIERRISMRQLLMIVTATALAVGSLATVAHLI
jgi:hypothetical protein